VEQWHEIYKASELRPGQVVELSWWGEDLLLYRTVKGEVVIVSAYCPHMRNYIPNGLPPGAPLEGLLMEDELRCPYHGWRFDGAGRCSFIPQGQKVPPVVRSGRPIMRRWQVREREGALQIGPEVQR